MEFPAFILIQSWSNFTENENCTGRRWIGDLAFLLVAVKKLGAKMGIPAAPIVRDQYLSTRRNDVTHNFTIVLFAALLCLPCLIRGVPGAGDGANHTIYQYHFSQQFWGGDYYPRWLKSANKGYGSPIFLIQYPLPYWVTALLRPILRFPPNPNREAHELGVFCFLVIAAAGLAARRWLRVRFTPFASTLAAVAYICLPYILGADLYRGVEIGQLCTFVWMPMALSICDIPRMTFTRTSALGLVLALLIMSNVITTFLFVPLLLAYAIACRESCLVSITERTLSVLASLGLGSGIAGVYVLPLLAYRRLFDISAMPRMLPGFTISSNLLLVAPMGLLRGGIAPLICAIAAALFAVWSVWRAPGIPLVRAGCLLTLGLGVTAMIPGFGEKLITLSRMDAPFFDPGHYQAKMLVTAELTLALSIFAYGQVAERIPQFDRRLDTLLAVACGAFVLTLPWCAVAWKAAPVLSTPIQFPHRLCGILTVATVGLLAPAIECAIGIRGVSKQRRRSLGLITAVILVALGAGVLTWRPDDSWRNGFRSHSTYEIDGTKELDIMYRTYVADNDLESFAGLVGTRLGSYNVGRTAVVDGSAALVQGQGVIKTSWQDPRTFVLSYDLPAGGVARVSQLYSPLWKTVTAGGSNPVNLVDGMMGLPLTAGRHELEVQFQVGRPELYGRILTLASIAIALGLIAFELYTKPTKLMSISDTARVKC